MKTYKKLIIIAILIMCVCIYVIPSHTYASELSWFTISEKAENFEKEGEKQNKVIDASDVTQGLANILTTIGVITVLGALLIIGIKYMMASPDEAAKLKKQLVGVVLAGVVIIGAFGIWKVTESVFSGITQSTVANPIEQQENPVSNPGGETVESTEEDQSENPVANPVVKADSETSGNNTNNAHPSVTYSTAQNLLRNTYSRRPNPGRSWS